MYRSRSRYLREEERCVSREQMFPCYYHTVVMFLLDRKCSQFQGESVSEQWRRFKCWWQQALPQHHLQHTHFTYSLLIISLHPRTQHFVDGFFLIFPHFLGPIGPSTVRISVQLSTNHKFRASIQNIKANAQNISFISVLL